MDNPPNTTTTPTLVRIVTNSHPAILKQWTLCFYMIKLMTQ